MQVFMSNKFFNLWDYLREWGALFAFCWKIFGLSWSWIGNLSDFSRSFTSLKLVSFPDLHCRSQISPIQDLDFTYQYSPVSHNRQLYSRYSETIISLKNKMHFSILVEERKSMQQDMLVLLKTSIDHHN